MIKWRCKGCPDSKGCVIETDDEGYIDREGKRQPQIYPRACVLDRSYVDWVMIPEGGN